MAQSLGCRAAYRPRGYFQDLDNLDWDLSCFVASGWVKLPTVLDPLLTGTSHDADDVSESPVDSPDEGLDASQSAETEHEENIHVSFEQHAEATEFGARSGSALPPTTGVFITHDDATIAHAAALVSVDCGDELMEHQYKELYEFDRFMSNAHDRNITTITHAGKIQPGSFDSSMALQAGYDAPDDRQSRYPATSRDVYHPSPTSHIHSNACEDLYKSDSEDEEDDAVDDDGDGWPADGYGSANSLVGEWYYYNTITQQVRILHTCT